MKSSKKSIIYSLALGLSLFAINANATVFTYPEVKIGGTTISSTPLPVQVEGGQITGFSGGGASVTSSASYKFELTKETNNSGTLSNTYYAYKVDLSITLDKSKEGCKDMHDNSPDKTKTSCYKLTINVSGTASYKPGTLVLVPSPVESSCYFLYNNLAGYIEVIIPTVVTLTNDAEGLEGVACGDFSYRSQNPNKN